MQPAHPAARRGQSMTEYIIAIVLVAIAVLFGVRLFGARVQEKYIGSDATIDQQLDASGDRS